MKKTTNPTIPQELKDRIQMLRSNLQNISYYANMKDGGSYIVENMKKDLETTLEQTLKGVHTNCICHCNKENKNGKGDYYKTKNPNMRAKTKLELLLKLHDYYYGEEKWTLSEAFEAWCKFLEKDVECEIITDNTLTHHKSIYNRFIQKSALNDMRMTSIKLSQIAHFYKECVGNQKITRIDLNNIKTVINGIFEFVSTEYDVDVVFPKNINTKNLRCKEIKHDKYTQQERDKLIHYAVTHDEEWNNPNILAYLLDTQLDARIGEIKGLTWDCVNWKSKTIFIHQQVVERKENGHYVLVKKTTTKSKKSEGNRAQPLTDFAIKILHHARSLNPFGEYIFLYNEHPLVTKTVNEHWKRLCKRAGVRYLSTHKNRVWAITAMVCANIGEKSIQRCSGHSSTEMVQYYTKLDEEQQMQPAVGHEEWNAIFTPKFYN